MKIPVNDFNLPMTLMSGQMFGYRKIKPSIFEIPLDHQWLQIRATQKSLFLREKGSPELRKEIKRYFDLEFDYSPLYKILSKDRKLKKLLSLRGLRIIRQDPWETIASFILSSNNNISRIKNLWKELSIKIGKEKSFFPNLEEVANSSENYLRKLGLGYRAAYLIQTANQLIEAPETFNQIHASSPLEGKKILMEFPGIGPKVSDCILLYGFRKTKSFPVDTWIRKVMTNLYFPHKEVGDETIHNFALERWGEWAGFVQLYLFQGGRSKLI